MLDPSSERSVLIGSMQEHTAEHIRRGTILAEDVGGRDALKAYLKHSILTTAGLAAAGLGHDDACELMAEGFLTAEGLRSEDSES